MLTRAPQRNLRLALICCCTLLTGYTSANNTDNSLSSLANSAPKDKALPLGVILDSQGQAIAAPENTQSAMEYQSSEATVPFSQTQRPPPNPPPSPSKKNKKNNRKQQLNSRAHIADDPSCRWLDQRMDQLEAQLRRNDANAFHDEELQHRQQEWVCMKCGAEGPSQDDYSTCQYKR